MGRMMVAGVAGVAGLAVGSVAGWWFTERSVKGAFWRAVCDEVRQIEEDRRMLDELDRLEDAGVVLPWWMRRDGA